MHVCDSAKIINERSNRVSITLKNASKGSRTNYYQQLVVFEATRDTQTTKIFLETF